MAFHLNLGTGLAIAFHLIATRQWEIDMTTPIDPANILLEEQYVGKV
jgi:hypothetical protein